MAIKKTISLQDYVLEAAQQRSMELFGGSISNYLSYLICNDNKDRIEKCLQRIENMKPVRTSETKTAQFESDCPYCGKKIKIGETIYNVLLNNGFERCVHKHCSRE